MRKIRSMKLGYYSIKDIKKFFIVEDEISEDDFEKIELSLLETINGLVLNYEKTLKMFNKNTDPVIYNSIKTTIDKLKENTRQYIEKQNYYDSKNINR